MSPNVGDTVLYSLGGDILRPMFVVKVHPDGLLAGEIFFYSPEDRESEWAQSAGIMFMAPSVHARQCPVDNVRRGKGMGEWRPKGPDKFSEKLGLRPKKRRIRDDRPSPDRR